MKVAADVKKLIDEASKGRGRPTYLGMAETYFVPGSELGSHYLVVFGEKKGWACSCRGFRFSAREDGACSHIDEAIEERKERVKKIGAPKMRRRMR